jgi:hypothetical protein
VDDIRLPEPMLIRSGLIPTRNGLGVEPKLDRYRCLVCIQARFQARSRRGWNKTAKREASPASNARRSKSHDPLAANRFDFARAPAASTAHTFPAMASSSLPTNR